MFCTILLRLFLPFGLFKKTANIRWTTISVQTLHESQTKWWVAPKRKTGVSAKHLLKQTADCTVLQSQIDWTIEPLNHWTKNLKSLKNMVCGRLMPNSNWKESLQKAYRKHLLKTFLGNVLLDMELTWMFCFVIADCWSDFFYRDTVAMKWLWAIVFQGSIGLC